MSEFRGYIATEHTVWCGQCVNWERVSQPTIKGTRREIMRLGWKYTRQHGWLCPHCQKTLPSPGQEKP